MVIKIAAVPNGKLKYKGRRKYFKYISVLKNSKIKPMIIEILIIPQTDNITLRYFLVSIFKNPPA